ncbi:MAG: hypothetical protein JWP88_1818, partial [Flaviaesturariibacter sp.]|nr:hypothetical protein [Flaviaesturariibacter sp.]
MVGTDLVAFYALGFRFDATVL